MLSTSRHLLLRLRQTMQAVQSHPVVLLYSRFQPSPCHQ
ncbi:hypothetical protein [Enterobacter phage 04_vB_Eclo_IJM]|nr:hypothetical protein [Enterobacter phage 04_vB_Eclo_IJM]